MRFGGSSRISTIYMLSITWLSLATGKKSETFIVERVVEIVTAVQQRYPSFTGGTCNTATKRSHFPHYVKKVCLPVVGVVPAIKPAARLTANGVVGLL